MNKKQKSPLSNGQQAWLSREINKEITDQQSKRTHLLSTYQETLNKLQIYHDSLLVWSDEKPSIKQEMDSVISKKESIESIYNVLIKYSEKLLDWTDEENSIKAQINDFIEKLDEKYVELQKFHNEIFWYKDATWTEIEGLKWEVQTYFETIQTKHTALIKETESILSGATRAWLAWAYAAQKKQYRLPMTIWTIVFFISLICLFGFYFLFSLENFSAIWNNNFMEFCKRIEFKNISTLNEAIIWILSRLPVFIVFWWMAYFSSSKVNISFKLQQEYAHKEVLSRAYLSYKEQIEDLWNDEYKSELMKQLLEEVVRMSGDNPIERMDKNKTESEQDYIPFISSIKSFIKDWKEIIMTISQKDK